MASRAGKKRKTGVVPVRPIRVEGGVAFIPLTKGKEAVIDAADAPLVSHVNWSAHTSGSTFYAVSKARDEDGWKTVRLHRLLVTADERIDHIDGDGLNNRRANLRPASISQNGFNRPSQANSKTGVKGVWRHKGGKWMAQIKAGPVRRHLGLYGTIEAAQEAYRRAASELHGEFARTE